MKINLNFLGVLLFIVVGSSLSCEDIDDNFDNDILDAHVNAGQNAVYEAENRTSENGCQKVSNHSGFTGSGFIDFGGNGTWIEWNNINAAQAGEYSLNLRYANGSAGNRQAAAIINGQNKGTVTFAITGGWSSWKTDTIKVSLRSGNNTIRIMANAGSGGPNLDNMEVALLDACPTDPNKTVPGECGCGVPEGSCGNSDANVARGKSTRQSSTTYGGVSSRAVDGNTSGNWSDGSITHTEYTASPWWIVDLGQSYQLSGVTLWNRTNCCGDRLSNFHVDYLNQAGNVIATKNYPGTVGAMANIDLAGSGVYSVRVQLSGTNYLSLAEVEVWGTAGSDGTSLCAEATENKSASLSCKSGETITSINFASYGLPTGSCDAGFATSTCHASSSKSKVEASCLNKQSCSVVASNSVFGDPCSGKAKRIAVVYTCGSGTVDQCPNDPNKTVPGECGCGVPEGSCGTQTGSATLEKPQGTTLRVASYNVLRSSIFPLDNGTPGKSTRVESFARVAKAVNADVWAMQEVLYDGNDQPGRTPEGLRKHMQKITGVNWYMSYHTSYQEFVFSRYPIKANGSPGHRVHWALIDVPPAGITGANDLFIISVHFVTDGQPGPVKTLVENVLNGKINGVPKDVTIMVAGDFNGGPTSGRYATVKSGMGVPDIRPKHLGTDNEDFTHGSVIFKNGSWDCSGGIIDYIFYRSNRFAEHNSFILNTLILDDPFLKAHGLRWTDVAINPDASYNTNNATVSVDHLPLIADFRIR